MRKVTTTAKIKTALTNGLLDVAKAKIYYKTLKSTETVNVSIFSESLDFLCKSGIFVDAIGWHYEKDSKSNGCYIVETGRMNPDSEIIITAYLSVCEGVSGEDIDRTLEIMEEE